jgi:hypothetical protein
MSDARKQRLSDFVAWVRDHVTGDEKGQAQIFLDRLFQAFGQKGCLEVGGTPEFRIRKAKEDGGGTAFADYVWKPVVLIEMKKGDVKYRENHHPRQIAIRQYTILLRALRQSVHSIWHGFTYVI